jgi:oxygen-dependent protoporphyrinogen oxidase
VDELDRLGVEVRLGRRVDDVGALRGTVVVAAPGVLHPAPPGRAIVLATLVVEQPALDAAPRGTGLLVAAGAPGVRARALTHGTAKWPWLRELASGRHVLRLSYDREPDDVLESAREDAQALLGVPLPPSAVVDAARVEWVRPARVEAHGAVALVGETVAGSGLAGIVAQANATADRLLLGFSDAESA